ncbi:beta-ketoacyl synthase N-terminal-like domain-containing protein [Streptomyces sp. NPDC102274]|uniref:beta-ketoacyl synthase N-terminal-like domain-containing protein n=1 Tax=Streptomyces sp. NPDC102274 TaxID=3366151 RepID=UPI00382D037D
MPFPRQRLQPAEVPAAPKRGQGHHRRAPPPTGTTPASPGPAPRTPGTSYTHEGGFADGTKTFGSEFSGIPPREAQPMDP